MRIAPNMMTTTRSASTIYATKEPNLPPPVRVTVSAVRDPHAVAAHALCVPKIIRVADSRIATARRDYAGTAP